MRIANGIIGKDITLSNISDYIINRKLLISSQGGSLFEGWAIHDFLKGKVDEIGVVGVCASAATIILLAAPIRWATPNARILIHNPYTGIEGDAQQVQQVATDLKIEQDILLNRYVEMTGVAPEKLQNIMNKSIYLTPQEAMNINLISLIKPQIENKIMEASEKMNLVQKAFKFMSNALGISNEVVSDVKGNNLDLGSASNISELTVGSPISIDGSPAQGTYNMPDGTVIECDKGLVVEITKAPAKEEMTEDKATTEAKAKTVILNNEITKLKAEKLAIETEFANFKAKTTGDFMALQNDFNSFKNEFSKSTVVSNAPVKIEPTANKVRKSFNLK